MSKGAAGAARERFRIAIRQLRARTIEAGVANATSELRDRLHKLDEDVAGLQRQLADLQHIGTEVTRVRQQLRYLAAAEATRSLLADTRDLTPFETMILSQNGEDGILLEILRRVGVGSRCFVEIGASHAEANCLVLADLLGWRGAFVDASSDAVHGLRRKYASLDTVKVMNAFVDRSNINQIVTEAVGDVAIDVFSLDIDGNDYWVWDAFEVARPRVVVIEYNSSMDQARPLVQEYQPDSAWDGSSDFGASLDAMRRLGTRKGYRLVHADMTGVNAFFVRDDLHQDRFPDDRHVRRRPPDYFLAGHIHPNGDGSRRFVVPDDPVG